MNTTKAANAIKDHLIKLAAAGKLDVVDFTQFDINPLVMILDKQTPTTPKVIIEVRRGAVVAVHCNDDSKIIVVDWDNLENGQSPYNLEPLYQDGLFKDGEAKLLYTDPETELESELYNRLDELNF